MDDSPVPSYPEQLRLDGRGAIVVGAGKGIGRQTAHALAQAGARVFCIDTVAETADAVAEETGGVAHTCDARDRAQVVEAVARARDELPSIDGLVDIVGMARWSAYLDTTDEDWDWTFDMVLRHAFLFSQEAGRHMTEQRRGSMVFVASVSGITGAPRHAPYGAAKAGLMALVRSLAVELGPSGVRANAVAPGFVWTPRIAERLGPEGEAKAGKGAPLGRVAKPDDIASAILFLVGDLSSYVNGQTLVVDGGVNAKFPYGTL
ncbi:MAG TPA: SDR family oxidoreductase [Actinomycetota bacterium]